MSDNVINSEDRFKSRDFAYLIGQLVTAQNIPEDFNDSDPLLLSFFSGNPFYIIDRDIEDNRHIYSISPLPYSSKMDLRNSIYEKISHLNINDHDKSDVTASFIAMNMLFVTEDMIK